MKKIIITIILVLMLVLCLSGCGKETKDVVTTYDIVMGKYTSFVDGVFDKELEETLEITYIDKDGKYVTDNIDPSFQLDFGDKNKVLFTNEDSFWGYKDYVLTKEAYNKIVSSSPMVVDIE